MLQEDIEKIIDKFDTIFVTAINGSLAYNSTERGVVGDGVKLLLEQSLKEIAHKTAEAMEIKPEQNVAIGERQWCIECFKRIKKSQQDLKNKYFNK